jgi:hypothetical protein
MNAEIESWISKIGGWKRNALKGKRSPHQPAVLAWFIKNAASETERSIEWNQVKSSLSVAISSHGGKGSAETPVQALVNSGLLELSNETNSHNGTRVKDSKIGLPTDLWQLVVSDQNSRTSLLNWLEKQFD